MVTLPSQMPAAFNSTYTPIAAAGTSAQVRHLARLIAMQLKVWIDGEENPSTQLQQLSLLHQLFVSPDEGEQAPTVAKTPVVSGAKEEADKLGLAANSSRKNSASRVSFYILKLSKLSVTSDRPSSHCQ